MCWLSTTQPYRRAQGSQEAGFEIGRFQGIGYAHAALCSSGICARDRSRASALQWNVTSRETHAGTRRHKPHRQEAALSNQPASSGVNAFSPLTWHYAGFAVLLVLVIVLSVRLGLDWVATNSRSTDALAGKQVELKAMDMQTAPLRVWTNVSWSPGRRFTLSMKSASLPPILHLRPESATWR